LEMSIFRDYQVTQIGHVFGIGYIGYDVCLQKNSSII